MTCWLVGYLVDWLNWDTLWSLHLQDDDHSIQRTKNHPPHTKRERERDPKASPTPSSSSPTTYTLESWHEKLRVLRTHTIHPSIHPPPGLNLKSAASQTLDSRVFSSQWIRILLYSSSSHYYYYSRPIEHRWALGNETLSNYNIRAASVSQSDDDGAAKVLVTWWWFLDRQKMSFVWFYSRGDLRSSCSALATARAISQQLMKQILPSSSSVRVCIGMDEKLRET